MNFFGEKREIPRKFGTTGIGFGCGLVPPYDGLLRRIRWMLGFFIVALVVCGLTAFPLQWELDKLAQWLGAGDAALPDQHVGLLHWIVKVRNGLRATYAAYPFMAYGTDWLAFAHIVVAVFVAGAWRDPVRNIWVVQAAMAACVLVLPLALICGPVRDIPVCWRLLDCSFGLLGIIPLWLVYRWTRELNTRQRMGVQGGEGGS